MNACIAGGGFGIIVSMKKIKYSTTFISFILFARVALAANVTETEIEFKTYPFSDPDPVPVTENERYPYFFFDGSTDKGEVRKWKAVILENDRIRVTILPEVGGKIWGAVDKITGNEFVYHNKVVKFRNISRRGPWTSGGIEFNFGIIGHAPSTATPVNWTTRKNKDGSVSYFCSDFELIARTTWQVEVRLKDGDDNFTTHTTWFNGSNLPAPYYQWMNGAFTARGNPRMLYPGRSYIGHEGDSHDWPVDPDGHDLSIYNGNAFGADKSEHVMNGDNTTFGIWWPEKNFGVIHLNHDTAKYGRKVFLWGLSRQGAIWEGLLTDEDGQYIEMQSGRCFNQPRFTYKTPFKHPTFSPGATDTFEESWGAVRDIKVFDKSFNRKEWVERPQVKPADFDWNSAYGHYVMGEQYLRQRFDDAGEKELKAALAVDRYFVPALNELALLAVRRAQYCKALDYADRALAVNTYEPAANYASGLAMMAFGKNKAAKERFGLAAFSAEYRSAAFALAAKCELRDGEWATADMLAKKSLDANRLNVDAIMVRLVVARKIGDFKRGREIAEKLLAEMPLCHGVLYEASTAYPANERLLEADFEQSVKCEFSQEVYMELGTWYEDAGLKDDAEKLFAVAARKTAIAAIRRAALLAAVGKASEANKVLAEAARMPIAFALPFRRETCAALKWAAATNDNWKFKYYAALFYAANGESKKADALLEACGNTPNDAIFYLYRAKRRDGDGKLADLRRAEKLGGSWRAGAALYRLFAAQKNWERALKIAKEYEARYPQVYSLKIFLAEALVKSNRPREAIAYMRTINILPSEFGNSATGSWIEAWGMIGEEALRKGDRVAAAKAANEGVTYPENLGSGRPYEINFKAARKNHPNPFTNWSEELRSLVK